MITQQTQANDELLISAVFCEAIKMTERLPVPSECDHQFSDRFYQKMRLLYEQMGWGYNPKVMER